MRTIADGTESWAIRSPAHGTTKIGAISTPPSPSSSYASTPVFKHYSWPMVRLNPGIAHESLYNQMHKSIIELLKESEISTVIVIGPLIPKVKFLVTGRLSRPDGSNIGEEHVQAPRWFANSDVSNMKKRAEQYTNPALQCPPRRQK